MGANWSESRSDFSSAEEEDVSNDEDWIKSPDDLTESTDSGVSLKSDQSKAGMILFEDSPPLSRSVFSSFEENVVSDDEDLVECSDDLRAERRPQLRMESMATGRPESPDSGVSLKSDWSKAELLDFKDRVSPRLDFSSSEEEHNVSDDEDLVKSSDDHGREMNQEVGWKHLEAPVSSCS